MGKENSIRNYRKDHSTIVLEKMTPAVSQRVKDIAEKISAGTSRMSVMNYITNDLGYSYSQAKEYYETALAYLCPEDEEGYRKGLIQANFERLENIIERSMSGPDKNLRLAKDCIAEMNKVLVSGQKVIVEQNKEGDQRITISFGG